MAAEAEIRQFWAPGQKHLALPFTVPAVATTGWWDWLAPSPSLAVHRLGQALSGQEGSGNCGLLSRLPQPRVC